MSQHLVNPKIIIIIASLCLFSSKASPAIDKIIIDSGYMHYFHGSSKPRETASLYMLDVQNKTIIRKYMPGCTCKNYRGKPPYKSNQPMESLSAASISWTSQAISQLNLTQVFFPKAWTLNSLHASFIFPLVTLDALGRTFFYMCEMDVEDYLYPAITKLNENENNKYGETFNETSISNWSGKRRTISFMQSIEFAVTELNQNNFHLWYALSGNELLLHIPLSSENGASSHWMIDERPPYFGWARCIPSNITDKQMGIPLFSVHPNDDMTPLFGVKSTGKKIYLEGDKTDIDNTSDWLVLFKRQDGTCFWRGLYADNSWKEVDLKKNEPPKTVIVNNDSGYIYISEGFVIDSNDIQKSMSNISDGLRALNLIKDYPPCEPSERIKKKLQEAEEKTKIQTHILELRKQAEEERKKQASDGVLPAGGQPPGIQRFLTEEDVREILDGGAKSVFTEDELKEFLAVPEPAKYKSSVELGLAYDWAGKFAEAKAELEKDTTPLGRFELGRFLMAGRPGIPADRDRANSILEKLVNEMEDRLDQEEELTTEEYLLAGKACHEVRPRKSTQWEHWTELGDDFFQQAIEHGERAGYYYIQYYRRTKPGKKPEEMWKALPTHDIEARAGLAAYAGHVQQFKMHLNQEQHLRDLKTAVQARCNRAQYWLGLLYSLNVGTQPGKYLKHNPDKARFWLKRAAERGDEDAQFLLGSFPSR